MKRKEFKETLFETLNNVVDGMSYDDKMILVHNFVNGKYFSINLGNYFSIITGILFSIFFNPHGLLRGSAAY